MSYEPIVKNGCMLFKLEKPMYNSHYGIWDKWLKEAKAKKLKLVVVTQFGTSTYPSYKEWVVGSKQEKKYHNNPNVPMIFYGRDVLPDIKARLKRKKEEKKLTENVGMVQVMANAPQSEEERIAKLKAKLGLK